MCRPMCTAWAATGGLLLVLAVVQPSVAVEVAVQSVSGVPGGNVALPVRLTNDVAVRAVQFTLTGQPDELDLLGVRPTDRTSELFADANQRPDGSIVAVAASLGSALIAPGDGPILVLDVHVDENATPGQAIVMVLSEVRAADTDGDPLTVQTQFGAVVVQAPSPTPQPTATVTPEPSVTPTAEHTATATVTDTPLPTRIFTPVPTSTPTSIPTSTSTAVPPATPTATASWTPTIPPTATRTVTPPVPTPTPTATRPPGDANCDTNASAPDVSAVVLAIQSASFGPCGAADVNGDTVVDDADILATIHAIFGR